MPDPWDSAEGQTHCIGDGCMPPHRAEGAAMTPPTQDDLAAARRRVANALHEMHVTQQIWISVELAHEIDAAWNAYDAAVLATRSTEPGVLRMTPIE